MIKAIQVLVFFTLVGSYHAVSGGYVETASPLSLATEESYRVLGRPAVATNPSPLPNRGRLMLAAVQEDADESGRAGQEYHDLMGMLALVPNVSVIRESFPVVTYVDYRAVERASGVAPLKDLSALEALDQEGFDKWSSAMSRVQSDQTIPELAKLYKAGWEGALNPGIEVDPLDLSNEITNELIVRNNVPGVSSVFRELPRELGVEWFAIDRVMRFGYPPDFGIVLGGGRDLIDTASLQAALSRQEFSKRDVRGVSVWHRFEDHEVRPEAMSPADFMGKRSAYPFGIGHGLATRIAVLPRALAGSPSWALIENVIGSAVETQQSLADHPTFQAAAEAITGRTNDDGTLVQAIFFVHHLIAEGVARKRAPVVYEDKEQQEQRDRLLQSYYDRPPLPSYQLAALADRQNGRDEVAMFALVYSSYRSAGMAATILSDRIRAYEFSKMRGGERIADAFNVRIHAYVHESDTAGRAVAIVGLSSSPNKETDAWIERPGRLFEALLYDIGHEQVFDPLIIVP